MALVQRNVYGHSGVTKQIKAKKCQLERRRRQRINEKLEKLKIIVMKQLGNDIGFYPPMEKADILELAIRCLEGKENDEVEESEQASPDKENKKPIQRSLLKQLNANTQSPKMEIDVTPIRAKGSSTTTRVMHSPVSHYQTVENIQKKKTSMDHQSATREALKPLLNHPINSITRCGAAQIPRLQLKSSHQSPCTSPLTNSSPLQAIWRPWTQ